MSDFVDCFGKAIEFKKKLDLDLWIKSFIIYESPLLKLTSASGFDQFSTILINCYVRPIVEFPN